MKLNAPDFHVHSTFSMLDGMGSPEDVVKRGKALGWGAVSLTDHGWMASAPALYQAAIKHEMKPIMGCEFYIVPDEMLGVKGNEARGISFHLTVIALSAEGYHNLVAWTSFASKPENFYYMPRISLETMVEVAPYPLRHNVALSGCISGELSNCLKNGHGLVQGSAYLDLAKSIFPNFYIEIQNHLRSKFIGKGYTAYEESVAQEAHVRDRLLALARLTGTKTILTNDSHFQSVDQRTSHLMMTAKKQGGGEWAGNYLPRYYYFSSYMQSMERLAERTEGLPKDILENAHEIVAEANIRLKPLDKFSYSIPPSGYDDPVAKMRKRSGKRLRELVGEHGEKATDRFELEIEAMGEFGDYLLLMSDFIRKAKKQGILTNTRGSAANSLLCYCLGIHDIDSIKYGLLFSRFFNPARKKLPDIDIDIDADRHPDFMKIVHEHMEPLVGTGQVRQISNYGTLANRSTFRMIAEKLGLPKEQVDEIAKLLPQMIDSGMVDDENDAYELLREEYPHIYEMAAGIFDSIKSVGQHACAWVFGTDERRVDDWIPLCYIASSGVQVTAYNMKYIEEFGLVKGDFLRLKTLSVVQRTRRMLGQDTLDITDIPLDDPKTFQLLRDGRTEGVFTLQGKENRRGVMEVEAETVHDVIRAVAIYRPALTREGRHNLFNNRRQGIEPTEYPHKIAKKATKDTYGVPVFQEQAMEIGYGIGMSDEEVDDIYRAIKLAKGIGRGAKEAFAEIKPKFYKRAVKKGLTDEETDALWEMLQAFQGYGFNKGHATSYGILGVRSAYLKANHLPQFFTALLDVYPEKAKYVAAARAEGFDFHPPNINTSGRGFTLDGGQIRVGLARVKGLGPVAIEEIISGQPFSSLDDFKARTTRRAVNKTKIEKLAALGALEDFGIKKTANNAEELEILGFIVGKPKAFKGIKPKYTKPRTSDRGWHHAGRERGADLTEGRESVSKLFWIPPIEKLVEIKASPWAQVNTTLLKVVDENGLPFHLMANEDKEGETRILKVLANKFKNAVICVDGGVRQPFLTDGPMGFRFYGITGADFQGDPQVWINGEPLAEADPKKALGLVGLHDIKRTLRREKVAA